jgi:hypothetical protein
MKLKKSTFVSTQVLRHRNLENGVVMLLRK